MGADDVIRFVDGRAFLDELAGNLGQGRAFVRCKRSPPLQSTLQIGIEVPGVDTRLDLEGRVVFSRDGFVGLELDDFDRHLNTLDQLGQRVEQTLAKDDFGEDEVTGRLAVPPGMFDDSPASSPGRPTMPEDLTAALSAYLSDTPEPEPPRKAPPRDETLIGAPPHVTKPVPSSDTRPDAPVPEEPSSPSSATDVGRLEIPSFDAPEVREVETSPPEPVEARARRMNEADEVEALDLGPDAPSDAWQESVEAGSDPLDAEAPVRSDPDPIEVVREAVEAARPAPLEEVREAVEAARLEPPDAIAEAVEEPSFEPHDAIAEAVEAARFEPPDAAMRALVEPAAEALEATAEAPAEPAPAASEEASEVAPESPRSEEAEVLEAPEPALPAFGLDALEGLPLPRISAAGAVRLPEPSMLLGLWLSGLSAGYLTGLGGPEGEAGSSVRLKLIGRTVLTLEAEIVARAGPWLTLKLAEVDGVRELLGDNRDAWAPALEALGGAPAAVVIPPAPPAVPSPPPAVTPSTGPVSEASAPLSNPGLAVGPVSTFAPQEGDPPPTRLPEPGPDELSPLAPTLDGDRVRFRHAGDLRAELGANLKNGGLFVASPALPIQAKKHLHLWVGEIELPFPAEASVVFAGDGKVGFSIVHANKLCASLEHLLEHGLHQAASAPAAPASGAGSAPLERRSSSVSRAMAGAIAPPPSPSELVELERNRPRELDGLERASMVQLFDTLVQQRFRGVVTVRAPRGDRTIYLHDGNVAFLRSEPFDERTALGRILTQHKRVSESALRDGLAKARRTKRPLGRTLVALGLAKASDVVSALREQTRSRLDDTLVWEGGHFELGDWQEPPGQGDLVVTRGLGILAHHLRQRLEKLDLDELEALLSGVLGARVEPSATLEASASALGLPSRDLRFLQVSINGRRPLEDIVKQSPLGKLPSLRLAALALALGLVDVVGGRPAPRAATTDVAKTKRMASELEKRLEMLVGQNHFDVLGVHWSAHHRTFRDAYEHMLSDFSLVKGPYKDAPAPVQSLARRCAQRVKEAFDVLSDDRRRTDYRQKLFDRTEREYAAQMLVEKGEVALMRGDKVEAIEDLETAYELAPSDRNKALLRAAREGRR